MSLTLIHGNRLTALAQRLIERELAGARADFAPDVVVVPSAGIARWLKLEIAGRLGVCANVAFPYPAQFVWSAFAALLPEVPARSPFEVPVMAWRLFERLGALPGDAAHAPLAAYARAADERARMELATRIAELFDRYLVFRPDWLAAWSEGRLEAIAPMAAQAWQAALWRWLLERTPTHFRRHPREAFFERLEAIARGEAAWPPGLPRCLPVFGVPLLPPLYLDVLVRLAEHIDVTLYQLSPCREFWADVVSERELARLRLKDDAAAQLREVGHPLLASWGRQARDSLALASALMGESGVRDEERFEAPAGETLLARLQRSMLELAPLDLDDIDEDDGSIRIHGCHTLTRQLEALHDALLDLFERLPGLRPEDIVVMTPDLDAAAPLIEAVFGAAPAARRIPFAISGRSRPQAAPLLRAFDALLALPAGRFEAPAIMDLIETPALARRFELSEDDLERIRDWLRESGVRWGRDAAHRASLGLPAEPRHTWADGIARLLLGHALPPSEAPNFAGLVPFEDVEGGEAIVLGRLCRILSELDAFVRELEQPRPPEQWTTLLARAAQRFFAPDDDEQADLLRLRAALEAIAEAARGARASAPVGAALMRAQLAAALAQQAPGAGPSGAVTFCPIGALRGLPYRAVCLLGLDDEAFPRARAPLEFDLMARHPRLGDRALRDDDRGAFLDALGAAGEAFLVTCNMRDAKDNGERPPSVVVAELIDAVGRALGSAEAAKRRLVVEHPLQPFSPRSFAPEAPRSYAAEFLAAARAVAAGPAARRARAGLFAAPLPEPPAQWRRIELQRLARFFGHPIRFLLRERLGISIEDGAEALRDEEPFSVEGLEAFGLRERLARLALDGCAGEALRQAAGAAVELPHGRAGALAAQEILAEALPIAAAVRAQGAPRPPVAFERELGEFTLTGALAGITDAGLVGWRAGKRSGRDVVEGWIRHLALNAFAPPQIPRRTLWICADGAVSWEPLEDAASRLAELTELYWQGLRAPLPFFPQVAAAGSESAMRKAWRGNDWQRGERDDAWIRLAYGEPPEELPEEALALGQRILGPALAGMTGRPLAEASR